MSCDCAADWRLELLDLATGARLGWLPFTGFSFEEMLNEIGTGSVTVPVRKIQLRDVWPHLRAVAFTRISGPGASKGSPVCEFIGMIETVSAESGGSVTLGLQSIEHYLNLRIITSDTNLLGDQNAIASDLVDLAASTGIPLSGAAETSVYTRDRTWLGSEDKPIYEAISELCESINGPDYRREYTFANGAWSTVLRFSDYLGNTTPSVINGGAGIVAYGIEVDGIPHANWLRGRSDDAVYAVNNVAGSGYPRFDMCIQWSDVTDNDTLEEHVEGYLANYPDPTATPDITLSDLNVSASRHLGDSIDVNLAHGAIRYAGVARLVGKAWSLTPESPTLCTFSFVPIDNAREAIFGAPPTTTDTAGCC